MHAFSGGADVVLMPNTPHSALNIAAGQPQLQPQPKPELPFTQAQPEAEVLCQRQEPVTGSGVLGSLCTVPLVNSTAENMGEEPVMPECQGLEGTGRESAMMAEHGAAAAAEHGTGAEVKEHKGAASVEDAGAGSGDGMDLLMPKTTAEDKGAASAEDAKGMAAAENTRVGTQEEMDVTANEGTAEAEHTVGAGMDAVVGGDASAEQPAEHMAAGALGDLDAGAGSGAQALDSCAAVDGHPAEDNDVKEYSGALEGASGDGIDLLILQTPDVAAVEDRGDTSAEDAKGMAAAENTRVGTQKEMDVTANEGTAEAEHTVGAGMDAVVGGDASAEQPAEHMAAGALGDLDAGAGSGAQALDSCAAVDGHPAEDNDVKEYSGALEGASGDGIDLLILQTPDVAAVEDRGDTSAEDAKGMAAAENTRVGTQKEMDVTANEGTAEAEHTVGAGMDAVVGGDASAEQPAEHMAAGALGDLDAGAGSGAQALDSCAAVDGHPAEDNDVKEYSGALEGASGDGIDLLILQTPDVAAVEDRGDTSAEDAKGMAAAENTRVGTQKEMDVTANEGTAEAEHTVGAGMDAVVGGDASAEQPAEHMAAGALGDLDAGAGSGAQALGSCAAVDGHPAEGNQQGEAPLSEEQMVAFGKEGEQVKEKEKAAIDGDEGQTNEQNQSVSEGEHASSPNSAPECAPEDDSDSDCVEPRRTRASIRNAAAAEAVGGPMGRPVLGSTVAPTTHMGFIVGKKVHLQPSLSEPLPSPMWRCRR